MIYSGCGYKWVWFIDECSCVKYVPEPEDTVLLRTALAVYRKFNKYPQALRLAMMLNDMQLVKEVFLECKET